MNNDVSTFGEGCIRKHFISTSDTPSQIRLFRPNLAFYLLPQLHGNNSNADLSNCKSIEKNSGGVRNERGTCWCLPKRRYFSPIWPIIFFVAKLSCHFGVLRVQIKQEVLCFPSLAIVIITLMLMRDLFLC